MYVFQCDLVSLGTNPYETGNVEPAFLASSSMLDSLFVPRFRTMRTVFLFQSYYFQKEKMKVHRGWGSNSLRTAVEQVGTAQVSFTF